MSSEWRTRRERAAKNEQSFQSYNERRVAMEEAGETPDAEPVPFVCECDDPTCAKAIEIPLGEYDAPWKPQTVSWSYPAMRILQSRWSSKSATTSSSSPNQTSGADPDDVTLPPPECTTAPEVRRRGLRARRCSSSASIPNGSQRRPLLLSGVGVHWRIGVGPRPLSSGGSLGRVCPVRGRAPECGDDRPTRSGIPNCPASGCTAVTDRARLRAASRPWCDQGPPCLVSVAARHGGSESPMACPAAPVRPTCPDRSVG